ncbi:LOW QUALITY PROTEIN: hypothetical protein M513_09290 [Trichuris suis]|uniref:RNA-directed DNA polymerase n=1 Tax=Trichuris suis TaxID=68888 RepID=A0A085LXX7_9BILA|nr:LOW QUALITY PROTEIN: hypothetical protein M513_09290 [Trichuris suis]
MIDATLLPYFQIRTELSVHDGSVLCGRQHIVVLEALRHGLVGVAHESHQGVERTKARLRESFWWPKMDPLVRRMLDKTAAAQQAPLQPVHYPNAAWEKIGIDIVGMFSRSSYRHRFPITSVGYYNKWPDVRFKQQASTADIICFLKETFSPEVFPMEIVSDNGFCSGELRLFLRNYGIRHTPNSLYYPQANGEVERFNRVLMDFIPAADAAPEGRGDAVERMLTEYRWTAHCVTEVSPCFLLHG